MWRLLFSILLLIQCGLIGVSVAFISGACGPITPGVFVTQVACLCMNIAFGIMNVRNVIYCD